MTFTRKTFCKIAQFFRSLFGKGGKCVTVLSEEKTDIEALYKKRITELDRKLREEIRLSHIQYETEYANLEKRFATKEALRNPDFITLEKALDEKYMKISTVIGEKYADMKNKLDVDFFNSISRAHFRSKQQKP